MGAVRSSRRLSISVVSSGTRAVSFSMVFMTSHSNLRPPHFCARLIHASALVCLFLAMRNPKLSGSSLQEELSLEVADGRSSSGTYASIKRPNSRVGSDVMNCRARHDEKIRAIGVIMQ